MSDRNPRRAGTIEVERSTTATSKPDDTDDLFEMANLRPKTTGLPMTIWVSVRGHAQHDARIKVDTVKGPRTAVVGIRPVPRLIEGDVSAREFERIAHWIAINKECLLEYWDEQIDTSELIDKLKKMGEPA